MLVCVEGRVGGLGGHVQFLSLECDSEAGLCLCPIIFHTFMDWLLGKVVEHLLVMLSRQVMCEMLLLCLV